MKLHEFGEIELLEKYVLPFTDICDQDLNNDASTVHVFPDGSRLIASTDPAPTPLAHFLGYNSAEIVGWYSAIISISDIAASGGTPISILVSVEMPADYDVDFYKKFNIGLRKACKTYGTKFIGGNLKCSPVFKSTTTAFGKVNNNYLTRIGVTSGDLIFAVGKSGYFWAGALMSYYNINVNSESQNEVVNALCFPAPNVLAGQLISELPYSVACLDSSDGLLNCCYQLARTNKVDILLHNDVPWKIPHEIKQIYEESNIKLSRGCLAFGDWQLVCSVSPQHEESFRIALADHRIPVHHIGNAFDGKGNLHIGNINDLVNPSLLNENFTGGYSQQNSFRKMIERYLTSSLSA